MNVSIIYGTINKTSTYNCVQLLLGELKLNIDMQVTEFFLQKNLPYFSTGYFSCIENNVQACPHLNDFNYIANSLYKSDLIILACPVSECDISPEMKAVLDDLSYCYTQNKVHSLMHNKIGLVMSTTAGAGLFNTIRTLKRNLNFWGVNNTFKFSRTLYEMNWEDIDLKTRMKITKQIFKLSYKILSLYSNSHSTESPIFNAPVPLEIKPKIKNNNYNNVIDLNNWKMKACLHSHHTEV